MLKKVVTKIAKSKKIITNVIFTNVVSLVDVAYQI